MPAARPGCLGVVAMVLLQALVLRILAGWLTSFTLEGLAEAVVAVLAIVVGAAAVHRMFCRWLSRAQEQPHPALFVDAGDPSSTTGRSATR